MFLHTSSEAGHLSQSGEEAFEIFHIDTKVRSSMGKAVILPNDDITAFDLGESHQGGNGRRLAIYETNDLKTWSTQR